MGKNGRNLCFCVQTKRRYLSLTNKSHRSYSRSLTTIGLLSLFARWGFSPRISLSQGLAISGTLLLILTRTRNLCFPGQKYILPFEQTHCAVTRLYLSAPKQELLSPESRNMGNQLDIRVTSPSTDT